MRAQQRHAGGDFPSAQCIQPLLEKRGYLVNVQEGRLRNPLQLQRQLLTQGRQPVSDP